MNKEFFSENELLELESIEVRGGNTASIMGQNRCANTSEGCGATADQDHCINSVPNCGGTPPSPPLAPQTKCSEPDPSPNPYAYCITV